MKFGFKVKVPLGPLPATYLQYSLDSRNSDKPITDYVQVPLPMVSEILPAGLFVDRKMPQKPHHWADNDIPLTYWHLTYFKAQGLEYTCLGVAFPHSVFDGTGLIAIIHALEAKSLGRPWSIPPSLEPGMNENKLQTFFDETWHEMQKTDSVA